MDTESMVCPPTWPERQLVTVRELAGLSWPWYHRAVRDPRRAIAWRQMLDEGGFAAVWGLTTAERRHPCYNFSTWCPTSWHGPVWPFETSKVATALIHALHDRQQQTALRRYASVGRADFARLLATFAKMHTRGAARGVSPGAPFVGESFHGDDGYWLTRELLFQRRAGDKRRGDHYLHSSYADLVLGGLVGIHIAYAQTAADVASPSSSTIARKGGANHDRVTKAADHQVDLEAMPYSKRSPTYLVVDPLFEPSQLSWFVATAIRVHNREVAISWDDGTKARRRRRANASAQPATHNADDAHDVPDGLAVWVDGELVAHTLELERLQIRLK